MSQSQPNPTLRRDGNAAPVRAAEPPASAERAFLSDARLALALLNRARYPVLRHVFGVSPAEVNLLTFVLALGAVNATYGAVRRVIRHPWPLDGVDTAFAGFFVQEIGFRIAGPKAREIDQFGALIAIAAIGSVTLPGVRRALHDIRVGAHVVGEQRMRIYGVAEAEEQRRTQASSRPAGRSRAGRYRAFVTAAARRAPRVTP